MDTIQSKKQIAAAVNPQKRLIVTQITSALAIIASGVYLGGCYPAEPEIAPFTYNVPVIDEPTRTCNQSDPNKLPFFGDTHIHTAWSLDGYSQDTRVLPSDAYSFAKGNQIDLPPYDQNGQALRNAQLDRPLDFAMVSDHAEFFGDAALCTNPDSTVYSHKECVIYRNKGKDLTFSFNLKLASPQNNTSRMYICGAGGKNCYNHSITLWQQTQLAAEAAYDRSNDCSFTSFIGYEWTGNPIANITEVQNLHRNVLFKNAVVPARPFDYISTPYPEQLWSKLSAECKDLDTGGENCDVLTIPHNSNMSNGLMFAQTNRYGQPFNASYVQTRALYEPLVEVVQHKGSSECFAGGNDEQCGFEYIPYGDLGSGTLGLTNPPKANSFIRHALKEGLALKSNLGTNPFKYGMIGSTDTHIGAAGNVAESTYHGNGGAFKTGETAEAVPTTFVDDPFYNPGGLAVVWAEQNTRSSLFAAMQRKEVYATSGPRHILRFFGGNYAPTACGDADPVATGYADGVPMGGDLPALTNAAPRFLVSALKDSGGAATDLQRIQIIKGWVDSNGVRQEQVFDVAGDANNGASVDPQNCNTIGTGASQLCAVWEDPSFDANEEAFYYARVLENPSCRSVAYQCQNLGVTYDANGACTNSPPAGMEACCDGSAPLTGQERSWSSPIWHSL